MMMMMMMAMTMTNTMFIITSSSADVHSVMLFIVFVRSISNVYVNISGGGLTVCSSGGTSSKQQY